ncbi:hypothetical protein HYPSUDRAFT_149884 [Hypholoma sublateritium FD-334 SS-4]|uniref:DUF3074 domain-containing protein n=1 Tax=Hypholoma sublateritium (strain FD-334 SS-4) TaxID=945553 RepID=A0A0D2NDX4_HYPSF|nr:hypothetical protein HYPSUDRAFT_149884 [Hypholoma sublateritium FD-334 SS-4]
MASNPTPLLTITPLKPSEIPPEEDIIQQGTALIEATASWKAGKTHFGVVHTSSRGKLTGDGAPWYCRTSEHKPSEITFDQLWDKLSHDKAENELQFIHEIQKVTKVQQRSPTAAIWTLYYTFTPPVSPRVFTELQVISYSEEAPRTGLIVSLPIDLTGAGDEALHLLEEKGTRGRYVSVERVTELANGDTEWRMATSSTPGGSIPGFIVDSTMAKKISSVRLLLIFQVLLVRLR